MGEAHSDVVAGRLALIAAFARRQWTPDMHPYTCGNRGGHPHRFGDAGVLYPAMRPDGSLVLLCPDCGYHQRFPGSADDAAWVQPPPNWPLHGTPEAAGAARTEGDG